MNICLGRFWLRTRNSIRGFVRLLVHWSTGPLVRWSVGPSAHLSVHHARIVMLAYKTQKTRVYDAAVGIVCV